MTKYWNKSILWVLLTDIRISVNWLKLVVVSAKNWWNWATRSTVLVVQCKLNRFCVFSTFCDVKKLTHQDWFIDITVFFQGSRVCRASTAATARCSWQWSMVRGTAALMSATTMTKWYSTPPKYTAHVHNI